MRGRRSQIFQACSCPSPSGEPAWYIKSSANQSAFRKGPFRKCGGALNILHGWLNTVSTSYGSIAAKAALRRAPCNGLNRRVCAPWGSPGPSAGPSVVSKASCVSGSAVGLSSRRTASGSCNGASGWFGSLDGGHRSAQRLFCGGGRLGAALPRRHRHGHCTVARQRVALAGAGLGGHLHGHCSVACRQLALAGAGLGGHRHGHCFVARRLVALAGAGLGGHLHGHCFGACQQLTLAGAGLGGHRHGHCSAARRQLTQAGTGVGVQRALGLAYLRWMGGRWMLGTHPQLQRAAPPALPQERVTTTFPELWLECTPPGLSAARPPR